VREPTTETQQALAYRRQLEAHLRALSSEAAPQALERVDLPALNFLVSGVGLARHVLLIEQASQCLPAALPLKDPESVEDATIVRQSSLRALEQIAQVLDWLRRWLRDPESARMQANDVIRELFHGFSNILVGISCYSELLLNDLREGDAAYAELRTIFEAGTEAGRLVRERASLQRRLNDLGDGVDSGSESGECAILRSLIDLLVSASPLADSAGEPHALAELDAHAGALPLIEGRVLREAARRLVAAGGEF